MPLHDLDWGGTYPRDLRSFLYQWAAAAGDALNKTLPDGPPDAEMRFVAEMTCRTRLKSTEMIRAFDTGPPPIYTPDGHETSRRYTTFDPPPPAHVAPARFTDQVGVEVTDRLEGWQTGAAVLFVAPDNKADSDAALALAVRAAGFLTAGVGLVVVDIAPGPPSWAAHLHSLTGVYPVAHRPRGPGRPILVAHPQAGGGVERYAVWHFSAVPGQVLPVIPVPVRGAMHLRLDLEATYLRACEANRVP